MSKSTEERIREILGEMHVKPPGSPVTDTEKRWLDHYTRRFGDLLDQEVSSRIEDAERNGTREAMKTILADISGAELDKIINRAEKAYELVGPLKKLKEMGKVRRTRLFSDYINEQEIQVALNKQTTKEETK